MSPQQGSMTFSFSGVRMKSCCMRSTTFMFTLVTTSLDASVPLNSQTWLGQFPILIYFNRKQKTMKSHQHPPIFSQAGYTSQVQAPSMMPYQQSSINYQQTAYFPQNSQYQQPHQVIASQPLCPNHAKEVCKRICTAVGCKKRVRIKCDPQILLCAECFYEDPDHIKLHKDQIMPIQDFLQLLDRNYRSRVSVHQPLTLPPVAQDLANNDEGYVSTLQSYLNAERRKITSDFQALSQIVNDALDVVKQSVQSELDFHYAAITQSLIDFKRAIDPSSIRTNPRDQAEQAMRTAPDFSVLQVQLRNIRDTALNQSESGVLDQGNLHRCLSLAEKIKASISHPPRYSPLQTNKIQEFTDKIKVMAKDLQEKMTQSVSHLEHFEKTEILSSHQVGVDATNLRMPINEKLALSNQPSVLPTFHKDRLNCIKALDSPYIVSGGMDGLAMLWNIDNGELVTTFQGHKGPITCLGGFKQQNAQFLVSGSTDKNVILWDLDDESNTLVFKGHEDTITALISLEDGQHLASGGGDRKIIIWDVTNNKIASVLPCNGSIYALHKLQSSAGKKAYFLSSDHSQALNLFRVVYGNALSVTLEKVILTPCYIYSLTSSIVNPNVVVGSASDKTIKVWNLKQDDKRVAEQLLKEFQGHKGGVTEAVIVDSHNSSPANEDFYTISCAINDERVLMKHSKSNYTQYYVFPGLKVQQQSQKQINEPFTSSKMQVIRNSRNEFKLVVVNQAADNHCLVLWDMNDTRIL